MVPASSNRSGWCLFSKELESFLSGSNVGVVEGRTSDEADSGAQSDGSGVNGKIFFKTDMQQKFRKFENSRAVLGPNALQGETGVAVPTKNGRPTREFSFNLTSDSLVLRVSLS